jgi:hypothetical protein
VAHLLRANQRGVTDGGGSRLARGGDTSGDLRREKTLSGSTWAERPGTWAGAGKISLGKENGPPTRFGP